MKRDEIFTQIDSGITINIVTESVTLAVLGIQCKVAQPLILAAPESVSILLMSMDKK